MFYIIGLGNPGQKYSNTRHNLGFTLVEALRVTHGLPDWTDDKYANAKRSAGAMAGKPVELFLPQTYMNASGAAVQKLVPKGEVTSLIVVHDDIDLLFGEVKVAKGRGAGGNNGVQSIISTLGTKDFVRVRIGIAPTSFWTGKVKRPAGGGPLERFVLKKFSKKEQQQWPEILIRVRAAIETIITDGVAQAMNQYN